MMINKIFAFDITIVSTEESYMTNARSFFLFSQAYVFIVFLAVLKL